MPAPIPSEVPSTQPAPFGCRFLVLAAIISLLCGIAGSVIGTAFFKDRSKSSRPSTTTQTVVQTAPGSITDAAKKASSSVVSITASTQTRSFFGTSSTATSGGTGFIITNDGLIATNRHVVEGVNGLTVVTSDGKTFPATVKAVDSVLDFALIKVEAKNLSVANIGNSDSLQVGENVVAIGNALGEFSNTVTSGVLSAKERSIEAADVAGATEQLENLLQTDAAINPGNSGGPLVNLAGQVIGVNTAVAGDAQGIGFAIPINLAKQVIDSYQKNGKIIRASLGVRFISITPEFAKLNKLPSERGALLSGSGAAPAVVPDKAAAKAGLKQNDIITAINGEKVEENHSLPGLISKHQPGEEIEVTFLRDGKEQKVKVKLDAR